MKTTKADLCREYRLKYPHMPTLKLARIVYNENKLEFKDVEDTRSKLRYIEGKHGDKNRKYAREDVKLEANRPFNPYKLPESDETQYERHKLNYKRIGVLSDIHAPYHSIPALTAAIHYLKDWNPDCILLNGDVIDAHNLSRYEKDPNKRKFADELKCFQQLFQVLQHNFPKAQIIYKLGNHDDRYQHFLWTKAGELNGVEEFLFENIIKTRANGIVVIGEKRIIKAGGLSILHGHEFASSIMSPVNIARGLYLRAKDSALCGHHHRTSEHTEASINDKLVTTWSVGCLSELHPAYMPINSWNHGFAVVEVDGEQYDVTNLRIHNGKVY